MNLEWVVIRGSGLVAFGLLAGATIWGLLVSTKVLGRATGAKGVTWFHEALGIASVLATLVHLVALSVHDYIEFTWADILIPGRSSWEPQAVAFGILAFYGAVIVAASFYVKRFIGQRVWRAIHFGSLGVFLAALVHGLMSGTDTGETAATVLYTASATAVLVLVVIRVAQEMSPPARKPRRSSEPSEPAIAVSRSD